MILKGSITGLHYGKYTTYSVKSTYQMEKNSRQAAKAGCNRFFFFLFNQLTLTGTAFILQSIAVGFSQLTDVYLCCIFFRIFAV